METDERTSFIGPAGIMATACRQRRPDATRETPAVVINKDQPVTRERWTGPYGVTERLVVPMKPGNSGGGKGPQLKTDARSNAGHGIDDESSHPELCSEVAGGVTRTIVCLCREPDAGNPPVRFDEREQETGPSQTGLRRLRESAAKCHRETTATAPVLDSTPIAFERLILSWSWSVLRRAIRCRHSPNRKKCLCSVSKLRPLSSASVLCAASHKAIPDPRTLADICNPTSEQ